MAIRNRKGKTIDADGTITKRKPGRPKKTEAIKTKKVRTPRGPVIDPPRCMEGGFHMVFPVHLQYKEKDGTTKNCFFQCENHLDKHIERYKLDRRKITIGATEPRHSS